MADRHNPPRDWRGAQPSGTPASGSSPRRAPKSNKPKQIFTILIAIVALAGSVAGLIYVLGKPSQPYFVPLFITEYNAHQMPVNFLAEPDSQALLDGNYFEHLSTFGHQEKDQVRDEFRKLSDRKSSETVVLYLCAFARSNEKGDVLLLPADYKPDDPETAVSLRAALKMLKDSPAGHKLLILDTMRPLADPRLGILADDVPSRISDILNDADLKDPHRLVLLSCSPGQVSLASEDLGRSIFGYYLEEGLRGWADGALPNSNRDGHVSARELAEFVKLRVDRWADHNRGARQTPILLPKDSNEDFPLVALIQSKAQPEVLAPEQATYPASLIAAWKERDEAWDDESYQLCPRGFREFEADLLKSERQWRGGRKLEVWEPKLKVQLDRFRGQLKQAREFFQGEPRSLTLARALGRKTDPGVTASLKEILAKSIDLPKDKSQEADAAIKKFISDEKNKAKSFDIACAAFDLAKNDSDPTAGKIRFLAQVLHSLDSPPRFVETQAIFRLEEMANSTSKWPTSTVRLALDVIYKGELAISRPQEFPWLRGLLDEYSQDRHAGEVFLWTSGCVSMNDADGQLKKAADELEIVVQFQKTLLQAERSLDEAYIRLPAYLPYLEGTGHSDDTWRSAAQTAQELHDALAQYPNPKQKASVPDLRKKLDDIARLTDSLRGQLDELRRPFSPEAVDQKKAQSKQPDANASVCVEIQAMLATPILKGSDRVALWTAGRVLSGRLNQETLKQDQDDDQALKVTKGPNDFGASEQERGEEAERKRAARRAAWSIALLKLSGLTSAEADKLEELRKQTEPKKDAAAWVALGDSLRKAWVEDLPRKLQQETNLAVKDRLNVPYSPFDTGLDDPNTNAYLSQLTVELKSWLTHWYKYESQDLASSNLAISNFYAEAVQNYLADSRVSPGSSGESSIQFSQEGQISSLTSANPTAKISLQLKLKGPVSTPVEVNIFTPDPDRLQVIPDKGELERLNADGASCSLPLDVTLKSGAQVSAAAPPRGFLVQAKVNDRLFHYKVPISLVQGPEILLSADSAQRTNPVGTLLALRPGTERHKYYLYVRNPTNTTFRVRVDLLDNGAPIDGGSFPLTEPLTLKPNDDWKQIVFGRAPASDKPFKDLQGRPLQIRLVDVDKNEELDKKQIMVQIASPRDYVEVTNKEFQPGPGGNNRLLVEVQSKINIPEPGCQVKLVLPPDRIPGYIPGREKGVFLETLTNKDERKALTVTGIQLDGPRGPDPNGFFYLTVDGVPRAFIFKTTFNPDGAKTSPERFDAPDIRFQIPPYHNSNEKFEVEVNVDNPPEGAMVLLELGQEQGGGFIAERHAPPVEARYQHLGISPISPDGALLFEAFRGDRKISLDVRGIIEKRIVRATLRKADGTPIGKPFEMPVILDNSEPINLKFVKVEQIANGVAEVTVQGEDPESDIKEVRIYPGKGVGNKPPANAQPVQAKFDKAKGTWSNQIQIAQLGEVDLTAEFVNGVDMTAILSTKLTMNANVGGGGNAGKGKAGSISGSVSIGGRKALGAKVTLEGKNLKEPMNTDTDQSGDYKFDGVPPGKYKLSATDSFGQAKGSAEVTVEPDKNITKDVSIARSR
jgi:hypothetical protein